MILHALVALWMFITPEPVGAIHLLVESGAQIYIDGRSAGLSSDAAGGMLLEAVPVGPHEIEIITDAGGRTTLKVNVYDGQLSTVSVSSLGLRAGKRRGEDATVELQVTTDSRRCELAVGELRMAGDKDELRIEHLTPGRQHVTVICGSHTAESDVDIPAGAVVTVSPDWSTGKIRVITNRSRITTVAVPEPEDVIRQLDIPAAWKEAILASYVSGIHVEGISRGANHRLTATFSASDWQTLMAFIRALRDNSNVYEVETLRYGSIYNGVQAKVVITFRGE